MHRLNLKTNWPGALLLICAMGLFFWSAQRGWEYPPTDSHASRQSQTAITAQMLHEHGTSPLTPFNGLGPPWNVPMEFPTYQLTTAIVAHLTDGDIISAGRITSLLGALLVIPSLWLLLGRLDLTPNERLFTVALLFCSPLWMHFSRSVLIESWAVALALAWLACLVEALHRAPLERTWLFTATVLGLLAALTKVTSFAVVLPVGAIITLLMARTRSVETRYRAAFATGPALVAAVAWTRYADAIKYAHPYADFLTSENLSAWNWGTLAQRLDPSWWQRWSSHLELLFPLALGFLLLFGLWRGPPLIRLGIGLALLAAATGPVAFANLYYVHNYYFMAVAPMWAVAVGLGVAAVWRAAGTTRGLQIVIVALLLGLGWSQAQAYLSGLGHGQVRNRPLPQFGRLLQEITAPTDHIVIIGHEWDPTLTFATDRPLTFVRETHETDEDAWQLSRQAIPDDDYRVLVAMDSVAGDTAFVHHRCRELGLATTPLFSTPTADVYVRETAHTRLASWVQERREEGVILPHRPARMEPGESRVVFITADWQPLEFAAADGMFDPCQPYPDAVFTQHAPAQLEAYGKMALHIHPPGGLRFKALSSERTVTMNYGLRPEIWLNQHDSDGVRFRFFTRGPDGRQRLVWSDFVQPLTNPDDQRMLRTEFSLPADHELELWIDAGPDHNPGYDWSIIGSLTVK